MQDLISFAGELSDKVDRWTLQPDDLVDFETAVNDLVQSRRIRILVRKILDNLEVEYRRAKKGWATDRLDEHFTLILALLDKDY